MFLVTSIRTLTSSLQRLTRTPLAALLSATLIMTGGAASVHASQERTFLKPNRSVAPPSGARTLCSTYTWACSYNARGNMISFDSIEQVSRINRAVNRQVREITDYAQFRVEEHWSLPTARGGDCEDFALLKKQVLIRAGFPPQSLMIATVLDRNRLGHAVLIVRTNAGDYVLDNLNNRVKHWSETGYIFLRMQNPESPTRWVTLLMNR